MSWRLAHSLSTLTDEIKKEWPDTTIWTIGDSDHRSRASDHNPNSAGVVCAIDIVGVEQAKAVVDHIVNSEDPRLAYMIFQGRIMAGDDGPSPWQWRSYGGSNPHDTHAHVSVGRGSDGQKTRSDLYDSTSPWGISDSASAPKDTSKSGNTWTEDLVDNLPLVSREHNSRGIYAKRAQGLLVANGRAPRNTIKSDGSLDGIFGEQSEIAVKNFQRSHRLSVDGIVGPNTWTALLNG